VLTVVTLLFLTGLFTRLPEPALAAIVIAAVVELIDVRALVTLYRMWTRRLGSIYGLAARADFAAAVAALLGVLVFDTLPGLFLAITLSLLLLLYRASRPHVAELGRAPEGPDLWLDRDRHPEAVTADGVVVVRVEGGLFFADADHVRDALRAAAGPGVHGIVLDARSVPFVDVTAARMLVGLVASLETTGVELVVARDIGQVRDVLRETDGARPRVFGEVDEAVAALVLEKGTDHG
jgi:sulfate permease, SulP family